MKRLFIIVIIISIFCSCSLYYPLIVYEPGKCPVPKSREELAGWIIHNIRHNRTDRQIYNEDDYWATVPEIEEIMEGDCEELCIYFLNGCYYFFGDEYEGVILENEETQERHLSVRYDEKWFYYPTKGDWDIVRTMSYREIMFCAEYLW